MGVIHFNYPRFLKQFENLIWVLNFFRSYMTIDIAYLFYIFLVRKVLVCYNREL